MVVWLKSSTFARRFKVQSSATYRKMRRKKAFIFAACSKMPGSFF